MSAIERTSEILRARRLPRRSVAARTRWPCGPPWTNWRFVLGNSLVVAAISLSTGGAGIVRAQGPVVQLPSYRLFTTNTAVTVPDRGTAYLGGVNRARTGSNEFGTPLAPFRNRAFGSDRSLSGASVSVYIHDFAELEEQLLGQTTASDRVSGAQRGRAVSARANPAAPRGDAARDRFADLRSAVSAGSGDQRRALADSWQASIDPPPGSIEEIRRQRRHEQETRHSEARDFFERGQAAEASGKTNVARIYYQMAARRTSGSFKDEVLAKLEGLQRDPASSLAQKDRSEPAGR